MSNEITLSVPQSKILMCKKRFVNVCAGRRFGKSYVSGVRIIQKLVNTKKPKNVLYLAPVSSQARSIMWDGWIKRFLPLEYIQKKNEQQMTMTLKNGSTLSVYGADDPDHLVGGSIDLLVVDECAIVRQEVYEKLRPSLSDKYCDGEALFISTPRGYNWFYELFKRGEDSKYQKDWASFHFTTIDGGNVPQEEIEQAKREMTPKMFAQEYLASFETMANKVYEMFDKKANNCKRKDYWGNGDIHVGMDFNVNPMTATIAVIEKSKELDGDEVAYVFDEIEIPNANTYEMAREIRRRYPVADVYVYPDPTGKKRQTSAVVGVTDFTILEDAGFKVLAPYAPYKTRDKINTVNTCFCNANGQRHIYIVEGACPTLRKCLEGYCYNEKGDFDKTQGYDHITDALAYFINFKFSMLVGSGWFKPDVLGV